MDMHNSLLQALFGCLHRKTTFPLTPIRRSKNASLPESRSQTYIACLECGKELPYDWENMQRVKTARLARPIVVFRRLATQLRLRSAS
jgi:hypothetical protein